MTRNQINPVQMMKLKAAETTATRSKFKISGSSIIPKFNCSYFSD